MEQAMERLLQHIYDDPRAFLSIDVGQLSFSYSKTASASIH
jgi:hypothetical protein